MFQEDKSFIIARCMIGFVIIQFELMSLAVSDNNWKYEKLWEILTCG